MPLVKKQVLKWERNNTWSTLSVKIIWRSDIPYLRSGAYTEKDKRGQTQRIMFPKCPLLQTQGLLQSTTLHTTIHESKLFSIMLTWVNVCLSLQLTHSYTAPPYTTNLKLLRQSNTPPCRGWRCETLCVCVADFHRANCSPSFWQINNSEITYPEG